MKIGILSDTHDQIERIGKAVALLNAEDVGLVVHCGDIVSPFTLQFYRDLRCPMKALFGNNTGDLLRHMAYRQKFALSHLELITIPMAALAVDGRSIAVYHGDVPEITDSLIASKTYDCVFSGHTHMAGIGTRDGVLHVNPGTLLAPYKAGMHERPTLALYETRTHEARLVRVE